jgi:hypothetical protein
MRLFLTGWFALIVISTLSIAQINSAVPISSKAPVSGSTLTLRVSATMNVASEMGGAFMSPSKCDSDGNLYIRKYATDRPLLGPVVKIDPDGKRTAFFDPATFSQLALDRADAFSPAPDGGMYQIAQSGVLKPHIYVLHFSLDGSPSSPTLLDADLEVYTFAAFADGNFLVSGVKRDVQNKMDSGHNFTAVFSADGRELAQLTLQDLTREIVKADKAGAKPSAGTLNGTAKAGPTLDLAYAEVGSDGNLYVMRSASPALVYVIASSGKILKTLRIAAPVKSGAPAAFHVSGNRLAISFWNDETQGQTVIVADAQNGRRIAAYADPGGLGPSFACYSADEGVFTFLKLGNGNALEVVRAEAQ